MADQKKQFTLNGQNKVSGEVGQSVRAESSDYRRRTWTQLTVQMIVEYKPILTLTPGHNIVRMFSQTPLIREVLVRA
jgi:hypothetical protein